MRVLFTPSGRVQFLAAVTYIAGERPAAAGRFVTRVERALRRLGRYPRSGRRIPEFPDLAYRELVLPPYRFFYRTQDRIVWIVAVWHSAQLLEAPDLAGDA